MQGYNQCSRSQGPTAGPEGERSFAITSTTATEEGKSPIEMSSMVQQSHIPDQPVSFQRRNSLTWALPLSPFSDSLFSETLGSTSLSLSSPLGAAAEQRWDSLAALANRDSKLCKRGFVNETNTSRGASFFLLLCTLGAIWQGLVRALTEGCSWCWEELGLLLKHVQFWGQMMQLFNSMQNCLAASRPNPFAKGKQQ